MKTYKKLNKKNKSKRRYKLKGGMFKSIFSKPKNQIVMKCPICSSDKIACEKTECRCLDCNYTDDYSDFTK